MRPLTPSGDITAWAGLRIQTSRLIEEGEVLIVHRGEIQVKAGPLTYWSLVHEGRYPLLSRYSPGMIELAKERRRLT